MVLKVHNHLATALQTNTVSNARCHIPRHISHLSSIHAVTQNIEVLSDNRIGAEGVEHASHCTTT